LFSPAWSLAVGVEPKHGFDDVATALCSGTLHGHLDRGAFELPAASCRQAAHASLEKLDRMTHAHFSNPEVLASLRLKIDRDDVLTAFEVRAGGAET